MKDSKAIIKGENKDYEKITSPGSHPAEKFKTKDGFVKWFDQKTWGTKKGSLGMSKETTGNIMDFSEFAANFKILQSK